MKTPESRNWKKNILFGLFTQTTVILIFLLFLPRPQNWQAARGAAIPFLMIYPLITAVIGKIMLYQIGIRDYALKLVESNNLHRSLFFESHSIMILINPETGALLDANKAAADFYGWSISELKRMNLGKIRLSGDQHVLEDLNAIKKNKLNYFQTVHRKADESLRDVEIHTNLIDDRSNPMILSIVYDITERKKMETLLKKSEYQLSRAETISNLGIWELDLNRNEFHASQGAIDIYGVERDSLDKISIQNIPFPKHRPVMDKALNDLIKGKAEYNITFQIKRVSDGQIRDIHSVAEYESSDNTVFGVIHDITETVNAQNTIIEEKERLDVTLQSIGDGVITTDKKGLVQILNPVAEMLTGWSMAEAQGKPLPEVLHIIDEFTRMPCDNPADLVLKSGEVVELSNHTLLLTKDKRELIIADSGAPIKDRNGSIIGTVLVFRDTTEKQKLQNRMQRAERLESLGVLAGGIAHDFNNLLTGIFGYLDLAKTFTKEESVKAYLDSAFQIFDRTIDLTRQLLTFSKGYQPDRKTGFLESLIHESVSISLSGSFVTCKIDLDEKLSPCCFDRNQIGQVLDNLLINAKQAMPEGGIIHLKVENIYLEAQTAHELPEGEYVCVSIKDSGHGITKDVLPRIFDPFYTTKEQGTGIGLATCYSILEKHDGAIDVQSNTEGTIFRFYLPAVRKPDLTKTTQTVSRFSSSGYILIMDDEPYMREIIEQMLESMNFSVVAAKHGEDLLSKLEESKARGICFRAAILDLTVPGGMGGIETLKKMKAKGYNFPVFATSGYSVDPAIAFPTSYGFAGSISKPFRSENLSNILASHLREL